MLSTRAKMFSISLHCLLNLVCNVQYFKFNSPVRKIELGITICKCILYVYCWRKRKGVSRFSLNFPSNIKYMTQCYEIVLSKSLQFNKCMESNRCMKSEQSQAINKVVYDEILRFQFLLFSSSFNGTLTLIDWNLIH